MTLFWFSSHVSLINTNTPLQVSASVYSEHSWVGIHWGMGAWGSNQMLVLSLTGRAHGDGAAAPGVGFSGQNLRIKYIPCVGAHS